MFEIRLGRRFLQTLPLSHLGDYLLSLGPKSAVRRRNSNRSSAMNFAHPRQPNTDATERRHRTTESGAFQIDDPEARDGAHALRFVGRISF